MTISLNSTTGSRTDIRGNRLPWLRPEETVVTTVTTADDGQLVTLPGVAEQNYPRACRIVFNAAVTERLRVVVTTQNSLASPPVAYPDNSTDGVLIETELNDFGFLVPGSTVMYINTEGHTHLAFTASTASGTPEVSITRMS